jgi:hypothetical protein
MFKFFKFFIFQSNLIPLPGKFLVDENLSLLKLIWSSSFLFFFQIKKISVTNIINNTPIIIK